MTIRSIQNGVKKNRKRITQGSLVTVLGGALTLVGTHMNQQFELQKMQMEQQQKHEEHSQQFEIFFSNYQDSVACELEQIKSKLKINCKH